MARRAATRERGAARDHVRTRPRTRAFSLRPFGAPLPRLPSRARVPRERLSLFLSRSFSRHFLLRALSSLVLRSPCPCARVLRRFASRASRPLARPPTSLLLTCSVFRLARAARYLADFVDEPNAWDLGGPAEKLVASDRMKGLGNERFNAGDAARAARRYTRAINYVASDHDFDEAQAVAGKEKKAAAHLNRAAAYLKARERRARRASMTYESGTTARKAAREAECGGRRATSRGGTGTPLSCPRSRRRSCAPLSAGTASTPPRAPPPVLRSHRPALRARAGVDATWPQLKGVQQLRDAIKDCDKALEIDWRSVKGLYRKAQALLEVRVELHRVGVGMGVCERDSRGHNSAQRDSVGLSDQSGSMCVRMDSRSSRRPWHISLVTPAPDDPPSPPSARGPGKHRRVVVSLPPPTRSLRRASPRRRSSPSPTSPSPARRCAVAASRLGRARPPPARASSTSGRTRRARSTRRSSSSPTTPP